MDNDRSSLPFVKSEGFDGLRRAMEAVNEARLDSGISEEERDVLEKSAMALRAAERSLIDERQSELSKALSYYEKEVKELSRSIRSRVRSMNKTSKALDITEKVLGYLLNGLQTIERVVR